MEGNKLETKKILKNVLEKHKPSSKQAKEVLVIVDEFVSRLESAIKEQKIKAQVMVGGSVAKGTFLKKDHDVDLFVRFSNKYNFLRKMHWVKIILLILGYLRIKIKII